MRILRVINSINRAEGGPVEGVIQSSRILMERGHEVEILSLDAPGAVKTRGILPKINAIGPGWGKYGYSRHLVPWVVKHANRFDSIIVHGIWQYASFGTWLGTRQSPVPYIVFPHGMLDPWFKKRYPLKHVKKWLYWPWAEYRVLRDAQAVLFTSEEERMLARRSFWLYSAREAVVRYGTLLPPQDKDAKRELFLARYPRLRGKRIVLFIGRIHPKKGCDLLIEAFSGISGDDASLHLVIAGPDPIGWRAVLQKLCEKSGIHDRITYTGMLADDLKWGAFHAADVFVLPSHQENFSIALAEALGCGVPVLISRKVNIWREVVEEKAGFTGPDTVWGTRELLRKWLSLSDDEARAMKDRAMVCFRRFEIQGFVDDLEAFLKKVPAR